MAIHEAYDLLRADRASVSLEVVVDASDEDETGRVTGQCCRRGEDRLEQQLEARRALRALAELPDKQRQYLTLKAASFSYDEIGRLAGGVTHTNVNKHLATARRRLRDLKAA